MPEVDKNYALKQLGPVAEEIIALLSDVSEAQCSEIAKKIFHAKSFVRSNLNRLIEQNFVVRREIMDHGHLVHLFSVVKR